MEPACSEHLGKLERKIALVAWLPYALAVAIIAVTGVLLAMAWQGKPVKTILAAWLVYLVSP